MRVRERPSPNHGPRLGGGPIDMLILHYTGMLSGAAALDRLCDPAAEVSAHYLIEEDGTVWQLVPEARRAWHAGGSSWGRQRDVNSASIGIELVNPGHEFGYRPLPEAQVAAAEALCRALLQRHPIPSHKVLGHSDVAPQRKCDPGELFDWPRLARAGIGLWPDFPSLAGAGPETIADVQNRLARIGYESPRTGVLDAETAKVVAAFQRHWRPSCCDGVPDHETRARIAAVAAAVPFDIAAAASTY
jgi:N-acetylmuramoyl-L-alanine amidase